MDVVLFRYGGGMAVCQFHCRHGILAGVMAGCDRGIRVLSIGDWMTR